MSLVDVVIEDARWEALALESLAEKAAHAALSHLAIAPEDHEIVLLACDDDRIAALNSDFRGKAKPTNVLSWPAEDLSPEGAGQTPFVPQMDELGDIALAYETCATEAEAGAKPMADHVRHLVVHGVLHLLGYDHETDEDAELMEGLEVHILAELGVANPYAAAS